MRLLTPGRQTRHSPLQKEAEQSLMDKDSPRERQVLPFRSPPPGWGGGLRNLLHSPLASHVQMNHLPGRPPTWDPLGCRRRGCHGPRASRLASTRFRVCTRAPPSPPAHWPGNSGAAGDWTKSSPVAVKFSASLKGLAFRVLDGTYRKAPLGKFSYKG